MPGETANTAPPVAIPAPVAVPLHFSQSATVGVLVTALAAAQVEFAPVEKNQEAEVKKDGRLQYKYRYADLGDVLAATRPALAKHGVVLMFAPRIGDGTMQVTATVRHLEEWISVTIGGPWRANNGNVLQGIGGSLTYLRRYAVQCLLGISTEEDTDANTGAHTSSRLQASEPRDTRPAPPTPADVPDHPEPRADWFKGQLRILELTDSRSTSGVGNWMKAQKLKLSDMPAPKVVEMLLFFSSKEGKAAVAEAAQGAEASR